MGGSWGPLDGKSTVYVCMHACMHACTYARMHVCMHACIHACMHTCMHVCIRTRARAGHCVGSGAAVLDEVPVLPVGVVRLEPSGRSYY